MRTITKWRVRGAAAGAGVLLGVMSACNAINGLPDLSAATDSGTAEKDGAPGVDAAHNASHDRTAPGDAGHEGGSGSGSSSGSGSDAGHETGPGHDGAQDVQTGDGGGVCTIDGTQYARGAANPGNACATCQPSVSTTDWANARDGMTCGSDQICHAGGCVSGCEISGAFYPTGGVDPTDPCQSCQPAASTTAWSHVADGTNCGNGQLCGGGLCGHGCTIGGTTYGSGSANPSNPCETCEPGMSTSAWTNLANGVSCGSGMVCSAVSCAAGCYIGGAFYASATANPSNACLSCLPAMTSTVTTAWSNVANGTSCGTGDVCNAGACEAGCFISGTLYPAATAEPSNPCASCQPGTSTTGWSPVATGTGCPGGDFCNAGACEAGCFISGAFADPGARNPSNACQICLSGASTTTWSNLTNGMSCGTGDVCNGGSCGSGCFIGGTIYAPATMNPSNVCQSCQPGVSTSAWSSATNGTSCGTGEVCNAGSCSAGCGIGGTYYTQGTVNPGNACESCQPILSTTTWSNTCGG